MRSMAGWGDDTYVFRAGDGASRTIDINGETAVQVEMVVDEGGVWTRSPSMPASTPVPCN
ncbi:MAG: hypothetical protein IPG34_12795 [Rhodocyclaceae bacterium]|nr:hypothetical protein [Rhodocyclaceae bacterium]